MQLTAGGAEAQRAAKNFAFLSGPLRLCAFAVKIIEETY